jgi:small subunit ribosomal protein S4e
MHTKRIAVGGLKGIKWTATPHGPHKKSESIPLVDVVRGLGYVDNAREARKIIVGKLVQVDGEACKDMNFGVGLMGVVSMPLIKKHYRVLPAKKGLVLKETSAKDAKIKLCRVIGKTVLPKGAIQVTFHDGYTMKTDKKMSVNDTVVFELPERKATETIPYAAGNQALVFKGRHSGDNGQIKDVVAGMASSKSLTTIGDFQTLTEYIIVTGKDKPQVEL